VKRTAAQPSVAFIPYVPANNAATRAFCTLPAAAFSKSGMPSRVFYPSSPSLKSRLRHRNVLLKPLLAAVYWYLLVLPRRLCQLPGIMSRDVVLIQRSMFRHNSPPVLEAMVFALARAANRRVIYHLDDALYEVGRPSYIRFRARYADLVLTGNAQIAAFAQQAGATVRLLDGWVQAERYPNPAASPQRRPVIGFVGTSPGEDLKPIRSVLRRVCAATGARLLIVGPDEATVEGLEGLAEVKAWTPAREFSLFKDFDIGIMPLLDTPYDRGREAFKLKEYMAASLPVVASAVGHATEIVEPGRNGLLAGSEEDWYSHLVLLVSSFELRKRLGRAGRATVLEKYDAGRQLRRFQDIVRDLASSR
jgi:glycosyltransferase involved in cell wall biosynthesis